MIVCQAKQMKDENQHKAIVRHYQIQVDSSYSKNYKAKTKTLLSKHNEFKDSYSNRGLMNNSSGILITLIFIIVGIGFKLSIAPSHQLHEFLYP